MLCSKESCLLEFLYYATHYINSITQTSGGGLIKLREFVLLLIDLFHVKVRFTASTTNDRIHIRYRSVFVCFLTLVFITKSEI